jgi:subtilisin family serine protease
LLDNLKGLGGYHLIFRLSLFEVGDNHTKILEGAQMYGEMIPTKNFLIPLALILIIALGFQYSYAQNEEFQDGEFVEGELIVKINPDADSQAVEDDLEADGNTIVETIPELGIVVVEVPQNVPVSSAEAAIAQDPNVEYVEKNYIVYADLTPNDSGYGNQSGYFNAMDAPQAWNNMTGDADVIVAVLDTGVRSTHQDIGKLVQGCNTTSSFSETNCGSDSGDVHGHGSGVAGTAAALTNNGTGVAGVCWDCSVMPVKVLGDNGSGSTTDVVQGIMYATNYAINNPTKRVVINMSLGRSCSGITSTEQNAINFAWNNNVLVITSAGNTGSDNTQCPANANNIIAVSATNNSDNLASFSSYGNDVDLAAPGVSIYNVRGTGTSSYTFWSGTSFSAPNVAGVAGLIWSANPSLTNAEVDQILRTTADNIGDSYFFGDGRVNADQAVQEALGGGPPPPPPPPPPPGSGAVLAEFNPGTTGSNTIIVTGAPAGANVKFKYSFTDGTKVIPGSVCQGEILNLKKPKGLGTVTADAGGTATLNVNLGSTFSGKTVHVQARVETDVCDITNKIVQNIP